ncbi:putative trans-sialidase [Trypanosoma cruzi]|nr:putative trans-sialidase [Trypanosoma cruzi]
MARRLNLSGGPMEISMADNSVPFVRFLGGAAATDDKEAAEITRPTTVVSGGNIYMPLGGYGKTSSDTQPADASNWSLLLVRGTVTGEGESKKFRCSGAHAVKPDAGGRNNSLKNLNGGGGLGVAFHGGTIVFPCRPQAGMERVVYSPCGSLRRIINGGFRMARLAGAAGIYPLWSG